MAKYMKFFAAFAAGLTVIFAVLYCKYGLPFFFSAAVTAGTFSYHFGMRLAVGWIIDRIMKNQANYYHPCFHLHNFEMRLYRVLKVKNENKKCQHIRLNFLIPEKEPIRKSLKQCARQKLYTNALRYCHFYLFSLQLSLGILGFFGNIYNRRNHRYMLCYNATLQ